VVFSILSNNFNLPAKRVTDAIDELVQAIVEDTPGATSADRVSAARRSRAQLASWLRLKQLSANVWKGTVGISLLRKKAQGERLGP